MTKEMDINAPHGTKIRYSNLEAGYPHDANKARKHLISNHVYTVDHTAVSAWSTDVYLIEVPGVPFNSVLFVPAD